VCIGASRKSALEKLTHGYAEKLEDEVIDPCLVPECLVRVGQVPLDRTLVLMRAWFRNQVWKEPSKCSEEEMHAGNFVRILGNCVAWREPLVHLWPKCILVTLKVFLLLFFV
jgi:hypothetical protein